MSKFKVGDMVIANEKANEKYAYTRKGWIGKVVSVPPSMMCKTDEFFNFGETAECFYAKSITSPAGCTYRLFCDCFDLYKPHQGKILIMVDEKDQNKIIARNLITGEKAYAKCNPKDEWNFEKGAELAFSRLIGKESKNEPEKKLWNGKVICVNCIPKDGKFFTVGKIYPVINGMLKDEVSLWEDMKAYSVDDVNRRVNYPVDIDIKFIEYKGEVKGEEK